MIVFSVLRTKRMVLELKELSISDSIYLCKLPLVQHEFATTKLLERIVGSASDKTGLVSNPLDFTLQERAFIVAHYLAHTGDEPNFIIDKGHFSDYIFDSASEPKTIELGEFNGDFWIFNPITGRHSESIERLILDESLPSGFEGWLFGAMAAALTTKDSQEPDYSELPDDNIDEILLKKAELISSLPESTFHQLLSIFYHGLNQTNHLLKLAISDDGFVFEPVAGEVEGLPPVRFQVNTCISERTVNLFGNNDK